CLYALYLYLHFSYNYLIQDVIGLILRWRVYCYYSYWALRVCMWRVRLKVFYISQNSNNQNCLMQKKSIIFLVIISIAGRISRTNMCYLRPILYYRVIYLVVLEV